MRGADRGRHDQQERMDNDISNRNKATAEGAVDIIINRPLKSETWYNVS